MKRVKTENYSDYIGNIIKYLGENWIVRRASPIGVVIQKNQLGGALRRIPVNDYGRAVFYGGVVETDKTPVEFTLEIDLIGNNYTPDQLAQYKHDLWALDIKDLLHQYYRRAAVTYQKADINSAEEKKARELLDMVEKEITRRAEY